MTYLKRRGPIRLADNEQRTNDAMTSGAEKPQITDHRAFRPAVALWFAALLGLGFFVMPESIHATLAGMLGFGGRAVFAGIAAVLGLIAGYLLAGRVSANNAEAVDRMPAVSKAEGGVNVAPSPFSEPALERAADAMAGREDKETARRHRVFNPREEIGDPGIPAPSAPFAIPPFGEDAGAEADIDGLVAVDDLEIDEHFPTGFASEQGSDPLSHVWRNDTGFDNANAPRTAFRMLGSMADDSAQGQGAPPFSRDMIFDNSSDSGDPAPFTAPIFTAPFPAAESVEGFAPVQASATPESATAAPVEPNTIALGDLSLDELAGRLATALAARKQAEQKRAAAGETEPQAPADGITNTAPITEPHPIDDPVVAFLRRETHRTTTPMPARPPEADPQAVLRDALDRLTRANKP